MEVLRRYALRGVVVLFCLAAWADVRPVGGRGDVLPVAIVDVSRSIGRVPQRLPEGVRVRPLWIAVADGVQEIVGGAEAPTLSRRRTRLGAALRHAAATLPGADVLVFSDGRDTEGDALAGARAVRAAGGRVFTLPPLTPRASVGLAEARLVSSGALVRVRAVVTTSTSGSAEVQLIESGRVADRVLIQLVPGQAQIVGLSDRSPPADGGTYRVVLSARPGTPDDNAEDDVLAVGLRPKRRVLLFWGVPEGGAFQGGDDLVVHSTRAPDLAALAGADAVVMGNTPWGDLGMKGARALQRFVAGGGRLLLLGGPYAYAGGGWSGTPLERYLSPLRVPREDGTGLAMVFALDRSGSTQGRRLAYLKDAVRRALQGLVPGERMGVMPFSGEPNKSLLSSGVLGWNEREASADLLAAVDALEPKGATDLPRAIQAAGEFLEGIEARERRVILLTDGDPEHPPDAAALARAGAWLRERDIRFGAFVVADDEAAARLARHVAVAPRDVVAIDDLERLPDHLVHALASLKHEASLLGRVTGFERVQGSGAVLLPTLKPLPKPGALHATEVTAGTEVQLLRRATGQDYSMPFAALRTVGAGQVLGLAWGPALEVKRALRPQALESLRPWIEHLASASDRGLRADYEGRSLVVRWPAVAGSGRLVAEGGRVPVTLVEGAPGIFRGPAPAEAEAGVRVRARQGLARPLALPARPAPEHRGSGVDEAALRALAAAGGGRRLASGETPAHKAPVPGPPLAAWFLLMACILLVLDRFWAKPDGRAADGRGRAPSGR